MNWNRILLVGLVCGLLVSTFSTVWGTNQYFFEPETLRLHPGDSFEWHLMMENDFGVTTYQFKVHAPFEGTTIFDPDTIIDDWAGTAGEYLGLPAFVWNSTDDYFVGGSTRLFVDSLPPGTHIAVKLSGRISDMASSGLYTFSPFVGGNYFLDKWGMSHIVGGPIGYIKITKEVDCGDVNLDGRITAADRTYILNYIYFGGAEPMCSPIEACADVNLDGRITAADGTYILSYIYFGGPEPCNPPLGSTSIEEKRMER